MSIERLERLKFDELPRPEADFLNMERHENEPNSLISDELSFECPTFLISYKIAIFSILQDKRFHMKLSYIVLWKLFPTYNKISISCCFQLDTQLFWRIFLWSSAQKHLRIFWVLVFPVYHCQNHSPSTGLVVLQRKTCRRCRMPGLNLSLTTNWAMLIFLQVIFSFYLYRMLHRYSCNVGVFDLNSFIQGKGLKWYLISYVKRQEYCRSQSN